MIDISEYDKRQLVLMLKQLVFFKEQKMELGVLVGRLEGLLGVLESVDISWQELFRSEWAHLEITYAYLLYRGEEELDDSGKEIVNKSTNVLIKLIKEKLEVFLKTPTDSLQKVLLFDSGWCICPQCSEPWEIISNDALIFCPKCDDVFYNPKK